MDTSACAGQPARDKPVFLLHIPKTGGNTVIAQFLAHMPVEAVWPPPPGLVLDDAGLREAAHRLSGLHFIHGHVEADFGAVLPHGALRLVTFLRHPVRLAVSHYLYLRQQQGNRLHAAAMALPIEAFYRRFPGMLTEPQTCYLARAMGHPARPGLPLGPGGVGFALAMLDRFAFVGVTERMADSIETMAEVLRLPVFPVERANAGAASREEADRCAHALMRDEFLARLGADFVLRQAAEAHLGRSKQARRLARLSETLRRGLLGTAPMPEVVAEAPGFAVAFLDGWLPQGWSGEPSSQHRYWWTRRQATLLVTSRDPAPCRLALAVVNTMGFDAAAIEAYAGDVPLPVSARGGDGSIELDITIPAEVMADGAGMIALVAPHALPFSDLDPSIPDHEPRGFAVRDFRIRALAD